MKRMHDALRSPVYGGQCIRAMLDRADSPDARTGEMMVAAYLGAQLRVPHP
jgi:hypothetical protein